MEAAKLAQVGQVLYEMARFDEAKTKLNIALELDPEDATAHYYLGLIQAVYDALETNRVSSRNAADPVAIAYTLMQEGKLLYEMGKLNQAETNFEAALALNAVNETAKYYLQLVSAARTNSTAESGDTNNISPSVDPLQTEVKPIIEWNAENDSQTDVSKTVASNHANLDSENINALNVGQDTNSPAAKSGNRAQIIADLDRIQLPLIKFDTVSLANAVQELNEAGRQNYRENFPVNFLLHEPGDTNVSVTTPALTNVRLADVLDAVVRGANRRIYYIINLTSPTFE